MVSAQGAVIIDRMRSALGIKKQKSLAEKLGVDQSAISTYKKRNEVPDEWYLRLQVSDGLNPDWLRTGEGEMYWRQADKEENDEKLSKPSPAMVQIPLIANEFGKTGGFRPLASDKNFLWFAAAKVRQLGKQPDKLLMMPYLGQHMAPEVQRGDLVIFDSSEIYPVADNLVVARVEDSMTVYRVLLGAGEVLFTSTDSRYPPVHIPREKLGSPQAEILGRVVGVIRMMDDEERG